eukprot:GHVR01062745.1.p1 GENE.GHVR01062745.1~~GHVR01062745.1.p1  ORF type:complete len:330 (+),score=12.62 GHVR01062745.1:20-1009(+)
MGKSGCCFQIIRTCIAVVFGFVPFVFLTLTGILLYFKGLPANSSVMAVEMTNYRVLLHYARKRNDQNSVVLSNALGIIPTWFLQFGLRWVDIVEVVSGYTIVNFPLVKYRNIIDYWALSSAFIDSKLEVLTCSQKCVVGAGYDVRLYRDALQKKNPDMKYFELDKPATQIAKRKALEVAMIDSRGVSFVSVDLMKDCITTKLEENGYDKKTPCVFLLENLVCHLPHYAIKETLTAISSNSAKGTVIIFDYFTENYINNFWFGRFLKFTFQVMSEPILSCMPGVSYSDESGSPGCRDADLRAWLVQFGFELVDHAKADPAGGVVLARVAA